MADALSHRDEEQPQDISLFLISYPTLDWLSELQQSYASDPPV